MRSLSAYNIWAKTQSSSPMRPALSAFSLFYFSNQIQSNQQVFTMDANISSSKPDSKEERVDLTKISLRPIDVSDVDDLMVWASNEEVTKFCTWDAYTSKEQGLDFINRIPTIFSWYRLICLDHRAIGSVSVCLYSGDDKCRVKTAEIGYILASKYWGKGIVTQVVKDVGKTIWGEYPHLERLEALTDLENVGSQRLLEKAGFQREGVLRKYLFIKGKSRDIVIYSLLPTDLQT